MSNKWVKYSKLYGILKESINWEEAKSYPLKLNQKTNFDVDGYNVGMMIQNFTENEKYRLKKGSILYNNFNPKTYFNFGFDINGETVQQFKSDYKVLSKILGIVVKSLFNWIKENDPEIIYTFADGKTEREKKKKLAIYGSILQGNESTLKSMGYVFSGNMEGDSITIIKYGNR
jgi:hypothetical protein